MEDEIVTRKKVPLHDLNNAAQIRVHHLLNTIPTVSRKQRRKWSQNKTNKKTKKQKQKKRYSVQDWNNTAIRYNLRRQLFALYAT